ncbi:MAG: histidine phosphatase family protein [Anaerolineae bacterium]
MTTTRISFIRHGHVHNPQGIYYGRLPGFTLSDRGRMEAQAAARELQSDQVAAIFSSPQPRTLETARAIAALQSDMTVQVSAALNEVYTPYDGQPIEVMAARKWDGYTGSAPEFEQPADVLRRVLDFAAEVRASYSGRHVVAVTHGDVIAFVMLWARGEPLDLNVKELLYRLSVRPGSITTLKFRANDGETPSGLDYREPSG